MKNNQTIDYLSDEYYQLNSDLLRNSGSEPATSSFFLLNGASAANKSAVLQEISRASGRAVHGPEQAVKSPAKLTEYFQDADHSRWILFFDEADALFGRRTKVKDSHDQYANIETSYLLREIENHKGIVILASNCKQAGDQDILKKADFVIEFPFPTTWLRRLMRGLTNVTA